MSALPADWAPPFVVLHANLFETATTQENVLQFVLDSFNGFTLASEVHVRSSGTAETIALRGRLESERTLVRDIEATIRKLIAESPDIGSSKIHWVVQPFMNARALGGLSNERRTSEESRDWLLEMSSINGTAASRQSRIAIRRWRHGTTFDTSPLTCDSLGQVSIALKEVAKWGCQFSSRLLMEWVWDGKRLWIVQADLAHDTGVNPYDFIKVKVPSVTVTSLSAFRLATESDYSEYRKLSNTRLYKSLGYPMPAFYVLDDPDLVRSIIQGAPDGRLRNDLELLTTRPLIVRTDSSDLPSDEREMLPRSDELQTSQAALEWLTSDFRERVTAAGLSAYKFCLIAHHFIPSVASAWARAEPGSPLVHIESLWGVPEGLYWHSHDTYEVDTLNPKLPAARPCNPKYRYFIKTRYKSTFVASGPNGVWGYFKPKPPYDWTRSIRFTKWLDEIAYTTRSVAEAQGYPVAVMWFIDNHAKATSNDIMPWYHSRADFIKAVPARKWRRSYDIKIETLADWTGLLAHDFDRSPVERVLIAPSDPELVRNREFVDSIGRLAKERDFVIELSGSVLAHAYFRFQYLGARVECVDLYGLNDEVEVFNKVVRDHVPEIISERGEHAKTVQLVGDALDVALRRKLVEEALETLDARSGEEALEELADVLEVIHGICGALNQNISVVEAKRREKRKKRGGFNRGLMLKKTVSPRAITSRTEARSEESAAKLDVISDPNLLPETRVYTKRDLREPDHVEIEKMFTVRSEISGPRAEESVTFDMPTESGNIKFSLVVEMQRENGSIRTVVRLRRNPMQIELDFPPNQIPFDFLNETPGGEGR